MTFPWTLQRYLFREMGKTFLLTAVALTAVLGLGGGIMNMIKLGAVTPGQLLRLLGLILPVAAALTLPIAALFSSAAAYGRMSAENEFVACRSSGINLHVLFLPTLLLSLLSASVTFGFSNYLIPGMIHNLNEFIGTDIGSLLQRRLNRPRGIFLGGGIHARADEFLVDPDQPNRAVLYGVSFVELKGEEWARYGTAQEVDLRFDRRESTVRISARMVGVSFYDRQARQFVDLEEKIFPANEIPTLVPEKIKFLTLGQLFYYRANLHRWRQVQQQWQGLKTAIGRRLVYDDLLRDWRAHRKITLRDENAIYRIQSDRPARIPRDGGIELTHVTIEEEKHGGKGTYRANRAILEVARGDSLKQSGLRIQAYRVTVTKEGRTFHRAKDSLGPVAISAEIVNRLERQSYESLLDQALAAEPGTPIAEKRVKTMAAQTAAKNEIVSTIHQRLAFSVSVFVLVILGAVLGIILRGSHALTAFGISFVPSLFVIVTIIMGKQISKNAVTHGVGLELMWAGIAFVAVVDFWLLTRVLRR